MKYAIVDIETTGRSQKITEIAIVRYEDNKKIDEYVQLINPCESLPYYITRLTGITDEMLEHEPTFEEVATTIYEKLQDSVFVAHHVNFDLPIVTKHLRKCGIDFRPKKLCTVRLSRKLIPGKKSYSLGKLCKSLEIEIKGRHRALGDAIATGKLWELFYLNDGRQEVFDSFFKRSQGEAYLPANLPLEDYKTLPNTPGVYYFMDKNMKILYIGKANNLRKRVLNHFQSKSKSKISLCRETAHIDFEESGSELLALLMENIAIKKNWPKYNKASKKFSPRFGITSFKNRKGIIQVGYNHLRLIKYPIKEFYSEGECIKFLTELCIDYQLCPKYCHLVSLTEKCENFYLHVSCDYCNESIAINQYNNRVEEAINSIQKEESNQIIKLKGRNNDEDGFILIDKGIYKGYGFVPKASNVQFDEDLESYLIPQKSNPEIQGILKRFI